MEKLLSIEHLYAGYRKNNPILENFSLQMANGESIGVVGQNGCGKSTLAKAIIGIAPEKRGSIKWMGKETIHLTVDKKNSLGIGYLMQGGKVFNTLSVEDNLKFALSHNRNCKFTEEVKKLKSLDLALLHDNTRMKLFAANLSGGERHILAFLMVMLANPNMKLLIADEPSAGIAPSIQKDMLYIMKKYIQEKSIALLLIEHNIFFLKELTSKILNIPKEQ